MDHKLLKQFVAAAHHLHFAHAAKSLGVPRSTVVASVRSLEAAVGYELFDKSATSTVLTPEGEAFLVEAERQLAASTKAAAADTRAAGGKAKASKGKGRAPVVKGERRPGRPRQGR
ncbi:DNA-binding transcriptional LysR family regulator [Leifsonia sp. AK011]|uniref:LysR family transcriptional regulator n=1 Tax=Leifsonia sp. AK011 TaxID=2723075 RepID=UPI0015C7554F|nr:LysR family transcriptional regulator [Leifsonia sp. AK011]NYF10149.1 DNA-binding transcriptional LysR family regulator [Leifsonia sp. AK011]